MPSEKPSQNGTVNIDRRKFIASAGAAGTIGLAGCTSGDSGATSSSESGATTIEFYCSQDAAEIFPDNGWTKTLHKNGLSDDIEVKYNAMPTQQPMQSMQQRLQSGRESPDIIQIDYGWGVSWVPQGFLLDLNQAGLSQKLVKEADERYIAQHVDPMRFDNGHLAAVPLFLDIPTVQYRKDLATEAGYDPEGENWATEPMTWKRFSEITKDIQDQTDTKYGFSWQGLSEPQHLACCTLNEFWHTWGGSYHGGLENYFENIGKRPSTVDEKPCVNALQMMRTFIYGQDDTEALKAYKQISPVALLQWDVEASRKPMANGNVVMHRNWPYAYALNVPELGEGKIGSMSIPYGVPESESKYDQLGGTISALGGWHMGINANTNKTKASLEFIEAAMSDAAQLHMFEIMGWQPAKPDLLESDKAKQAGVLGKFVDTFRVSADQNLISRPITRLWTDEFQFYADEASATLKQEKSSQQAMSDLAARIEDYEKQA